MYVYICVKICAPLHYISMHIYIVKRVKIITSHANELKYERQFNSGTHTNVTLSHVTYM